MKLNEASSRSNELDLSFLKTVEILKKAGAVPFVRTNCPQTMMIGQTKNEIFGETLNPHNRSLTSGGSSGGGGALIAMHGSPLGVGTDIGGSG